LENYQMKQTEIVLGHNMGIWKNCDYKIWDKPLKTNLGYSIPSGNGSHVEQHRKKPIGTENILQISNITQNCNESITYDIYIYPPDNRPYSHVTRDLLLLKTW
jgi:hypothetical protein